MPDDLPARRLTTIVALDVAGYSAAEVVALRRMIEGIATAQGGRGFHTAGDGFMLELGSSLAAADDREMQFFSDGVSEEIVQRLSRGAPMKVIGPTSSFQFRGADKTARSVAKELKCSHILAFSSSRPLRSRTRRAGASGNLAAHDHGRRVRGV